MKGILCLQDLRDREALRPRFGSVTVCDPPASGKDPVAGSQGSFETGRESQIFGRFDILSEEWEANELGTY